jgi:hypothetical protein
VSGRGVPLVLFSFKALRECPVHRTEFWHRNGDKAIPSPKLFNELLKPYVRYGREQQDLEYATARLPKANAQRDGALGEIADWLMDIGLRYWIGTPGVRVVTYPCKTSPNALSSSKLPWAWLVRSPVGSLQVTDLPLDPATMEIAKFGTMKVSAKCRP